MKIVHFPQADIVLGAPADWDHEKHGECVGLPVKRQNGECVSCWEPTAKELDQLARGAKVWLHVHSGETQPPVMLSVEWLPGERPKEEPYG